MTEFLASPWAEDFDGLIAEARSSLVISSPFISREPCERIQLSLEKTNRTASLEVFVLTNLSRENLVSGATDAGALADLMGAVPDMAVRFLPSLHAKVYVADERRAIVTSANMTGSGLLRNHEMGVLVTNRSWVRRVRRQVLDYAALGSTVNRNELETFAQITREVRELRQQLERSSRRRLRHEFDLRVRTAEEQILRVRTAGRTAHAIFCDAIMHILARRPARTDELHEEVRRIHPDLCDDAVDRVIDGRHFGKRWKHAVRTAQQHLKRLSKVRYESGLWYLTHPASAAQLRVAEPILP